MRITLGRLRSLIGEALSPHRQEREELKASIIGTKHRDVHVRAGSKLAKKIEPELVDMVAQSYASVGGNPKISNPGDLTDEYPEWVVADLDDDPDVDVFVGGRDTRAGTKMAVSATDGSAPAKQHLLQMKKKLYDSGWWGEVSGAPAHIALNKLRIPAVEDEASVRELLGDKDITWHGEHPEGKFPGTRGWYSRDIGGKQHLKIIVGNV